ncbi:MAG: hypothetical protein HW413_2404 [Thermoleophilia bacterium]|nr:hypothetical protein [Thermoleophilia bacterium]
MKPSFAILAALTVLVAALSASSRPSVAPASPSVIAAAPPATAFLPQPPMPPRQIVFFGYVKSLTRSGARYVMRVDPAALLSGVTANRAAIEDKVIAPGDVVPNDYYVRDEGHKLLTYLVPSTAHVTVLTNPGTGPRATPISVAELAQIVKGKNPKKRPLFEPKNGFWIRVQGDTVRALDQQYTP